jgi:murein DD-endopeptidase MepM/ murein hydrolase activator NlpD
MKFRRPQKARIGEVLLRRGLITQAQLEQALAQQKQTGLMLGEVLIQHKMINARQLQQALTQQSWQNLLATALLSLGTLTAALHKVAVVQIEAPTGGGESSGALASPGRQGRSAQLMASFTAHPNQAAPDPSPTLNSAVDAIPLAARPSEASPLIGFCHPLQQPAKLTQGAHGVTHRGRMEYAMDFKAAIGTPVYAMRSGRVIGLEDRFPDSGGGRENIHRFNYVLIEHEGGYRSAYLHLQQKFRSWVTLKVGDRVKAGQLIAFSGNSGWSTGPHLHIEVQKSSQPGTFGQTVPFQENRSCFSPETIASSEK